MYFLQEDRDVRSSSTSVSSVSSKDYHFLNQEWGSVASRLQTEDLTCGSHTSLELGLSCLSSIRINSYLSLLIDISFDPASLLLSSYFFSLIKCFSDSTWINWITPPISPTLCTENPLVGSCWYIPPPSPTPVIYVDSNNTQGAPEV